MGTLGGSGYIRRAFRCGVLFLLPSGLILCSMPSRAQSQGPSNADQQLAVQLNKDGIGLAKKSDYASAIEKFRRASELWPQFPDSQYNLAATLEKIGQIDQAINAYRVAVRLRPDSALMHLALGLALAKKQELAGAASELQRAVELAPQDHLAHYNLGLTYEQQGKRQDALAEY